MKPPINPPLYKRGRNYWRAIWGGSIFSNSLLTLFILLSWEKPAFLIIQCVGYSVLLLSILFATQLFKTKWFAFLGIFFAALTTSIVAGSKFRLKDFEPVDGSAYALLMLAGGYLITSFYLLYSPEIRYFWEKKFKGKSRK